ncbi:MAG: YncE family protein [Gemmatimonas sp.]
MTKLFPFTSTVALAAAALAPLATAQTSQPLALDYRIPLDGVSGRIDHMAVDLGRGRLIVAELGNDTLDIVDLKAGASVARVHGVGEPQGVAYLPEPDLIAAASARDGTVHLFRGADGSPAGVVRLGSDADNLRLDGDHLVAGYGKGALAWIDAVRGEKLFDVALPGHPEGFRLHPIDGRVFVNVPDAGEISVVDRASRKRVAGWKVERGVANFPMAISAIGDQIAVVYRKPARLGLFNTGNGAQAASAPTCGDSDDVFFDPKRPHVYVSCGEGAVEVFEQNENGLSSLGRVATSPGARTSLFVPELDRLFVAARATSSPAAILVYRPVP